MGQFRLGRCLEGFDLDVERRCPPEHGFRRSVLAGRVHALQDDEDFRTLHGVELVRKFGNAFRPFLGRRFRFALTLEYIDMRRAIGKFERLSRFGEVRAVWMYGHDYLLWAHEREGESEEIN